MRNFYCLTLCFAICLTNLYAQEIYRTKPSSEELNIWGINPFLIKDKYERMVRRTYDAKSDSMIEVAYYDKNLQELNGEYLVCETVTDTDTNIVYAGPFLDERPPIITVRTFYGEKGLKDKNVASLCGMANVVTRINHVYGIMQGPYSAVSHFYGGNCDNLIKINGTYINNKKQGVWTEEYQMDCGGLMDTRFDFLNGSEHTITKTTYDNNKIISVVKSKYLNKN